MNASSIYVFTLEPDEAYCQWVWACKRRVRQLVGDQLYLDHPPHLTLYVAAMASRVELCQRVANLAARLAAPRTPMNRWHVFSADQLTGNQTLVCDVPEESREGFRDIQSQVVVALAPLRDATACRSRYDGSWERLSAVERANVEQFGFPFVGPIWHAHVTIASIRPENWPAVHSVLEGSPPSAPVCFTHLGVYVLNKEHPVPVERYKLQDCS